MLITPPGVTLARHRVDSERTGTAVAFDLPMPDETARLATVWLVLADGTLTNELASEWAFENGILAEAGHEL